jgi:hypothetical protein
MAPLRAVPAAIASAAADAYISVVYVILRPMFGLAGRWRERGRG